MNDTTQSEPAQAAGPEVKPLARPTTLDLVPQELRLSGRFILHDENKIPLRADGSRAFLAPTPRSESWIGNEAEARIARAKVLHADGVGYDLGEPIAGRDYDDCVAKVFDDNGVLTDLIIDAAVAEDLRDMATYAEFSQSCFKPDEPRGGIKALFHTAKIPAEKRVKPQGAELYFKDRYFALTGARVPGCPSELARVEPAVLEQCIKRHAGVVAAAKPKHCRKVRAGVDPIELLKKAGLVFRPKGQYIIYHNLGQSQPCLVKGEVHQGNGNPRNPRCSAFVWNPETRELFHTCLAEGCRAQSGKKTEVALDRLGINPDEVFEAHVALDDSDQALVAGFADSKSDEFCYLTDDQSWWGYDPATGLWLERRRGPIYEIGEYIKAQEPPTANKTLHRRLHSEKAVSAVERLAKDRPEFRAQANQFDPDPWLLGLPGSRVLGLRTGEECGAKPSDLLTRSLPVASSKLPPKESCPRWLQYLEEVHPNDPELHAYLQRFFGYALTSSVREECIIFFIGKGGSGKNTCYETIQAVFGSYCHQLPLDLLLEEAKEDRRLNHVADLLGKRLGICNEGARSKKLDRNALKNLSGGGMVKGRRLGHQAFDFPMQAKILIVANDPPVLDLDEAMKQRVHVVPFNVVFRNVPGKDDKGLKDYFKTHELPGIARWITDGCLEWQRLGGLNPPTSVVSRTKEYFVSSDTIDQFLAECCEFSPELFGETNMLFRAAKKFCEDRGEKTTITTERLFVSELMQRMEQRNMRLEPARPKGKGFSGKSGFWGIKLKEGREAPDPPKPREIPF